VYISNSENLDTFWIYFSVLPFQKILRGLIFASAMILKKNFFWI